MVLGIFNNILDGFNDFIEIVQNFISHNYDNPMFWLGIFVIVLVIASLFISKIGNK